MNNSEQNPTSCQTDVSSRLNMYNRTEHAKEIAQSLIDSFLVAQFRVGDMKRHRLLAIESSIVAIDFFLNKSRKGDDYDYGLYEECRSQLIVLRQNPEAVKDLLNNNMPPVSEQKCVVPNCKNGPIKEAFHGLCSQHIWPNG